MIRMILFITNHYSSLVQRLQTPHENGLQKVEWSQLQSGTIFESLKRKKSPKGEHEWYFKQDTIFDIYTANASTVKISSYENFITSISFLTNLRANMQVLIISDYALQNLDSLTLWDYPVLNQVSIGYNSFFFTYPAPIPSGDGYGRGFVRVKNCPNLKIFALKEWSFVSATDFELEGN